MFFSDKKEKKIQTYLKTKNMHHRRQSGHLVYQFGSTYTNEMGPFWRNINTVRRYNLPHRLFNSLEDTIFTHQGYKLLENEDFLTLASKMEIIFTQYVQDLMVHRQNDAEALENGISTSKERIPEYLRIGNTCFTTFSIEGGNCCEMDKVIYSNNCISILCVVASDCDTVQLSMHETKENDEEQVTDVISFNTRRGDVFCGEMEHLHINTHSFGGTRYVIRFSTCSKILQHFILHPPVIWTCYSTKKYPISRNKTSKKKVPIVEYNEATYRCTLKWINKNLTPAEAKQLEQEMKDEVFKGYVDVSFTQTDLNKLSQIMCPRCCSKCF
jgi:hypothetical protein